MARPVTGLCVCLLACVGAAAGAPVVWWSSKAPVKNASEVDAAMGKPWPDPIAVKRGGASGTITNCATSLDLQAKGFRPESDREYQALQSLTVPCLVLRLFRTAKPARQSALAGVRWDESAVSQLPPAVGLVISKDDERRVSEAAAKGQSWKQTEPGLQVQRADAEELLVSGEGWRVTLTLLGRGDLDNDGWEDLLVEARGALRPGSYRSVRLLLLTRKQSRGLLQQKEVRP